jgi:hypothetical protein
LVLGPLATDAYADREPHSHRGGDAHSFYGRDYGDWRRGHWEHGHHDGHFGWWWVIGGLWLFYPQPVYPYPPEPYSPPVVVVQPAPTAPPPQAQYWYYCDAAGAYYPYVASCPSGWRQVPVTPPGATP